MAKIRFDGLQRYEKILSTMADKAEVLTKRALYDGAGEMAGAIRTAVTELPIVSGYGSAKKMLPGGVTKRQKAGLLEGLGVSTMEKVRSGGWNVKIGFDGYNTTKTEKYPNGQPNALVARGVESGTSWKQKNPFIRRAVSENKERIEAVMAQTFDQELEKLNK